MKINLTLVITCCMVVAVCSFKEYQVVSLNNTNRYRRHHNVVELEMKDDVRLNKLKKLMKYQGTEELYCLLFLVEHDC